MTEPSTDFTHYMSSIRDMTKKLDPTGDGVNNKPMVNALSQKCGGTNHGGNIENVCRYVPQTLSVRLELTWCHHPRNLSREAEMYHGSLLMVPGGAVNFPISDMRFNVTGTGGTMSYMHSDPSGLGTGVIPTSDGRFWIIVTGKGGLNILETPGVFQVKGSTYVDPTVGTDLVEYWAIELTPEVSV